MNLRFGHLARGHGEFPMTRTASAADVAVDGYVVGRVGEDHLGDLAVQQVVIGGRPGRIRTQQPVPAEPPQITGTGDRRRVVDRRQPVGLVLVPGAVESGDQRIDLGRLEARDLDVEVEVDGRERLQLNRQEFLVPARELRQAVVRDEVGAPLRLVQIANANRGHLGQPEPLRRLQPGVPGHHLAALVDQDRIGEAERADAVGDPPDLPFTMGPRIARVGLEGQYRLIGDRRPAGGAIGRRARRGFRFRCFLHQKPLSRSIDILESAAGARHRRGSTEGLDRVDQRWRNRSREAKSHGDNIPALESFNVGPDRFQCSIFWRIWQNPRVISGPFGECSHRSGALSN